MTYYLTPAPLLALRTVTYCTENEWTPRRGVETVEIGRQLS